jgi:hypothetical protein
MLLSMSAFAADLSDATIDQSARGSITVHKYDTTTASKAPSDGGVSWTPDMFLSDGKPNQQAEDKLAPYAIQGVEYTAIKVGEVNTYTVQKSQNNGIQKVYGINSAKLLTALDLDAYNVHAITSISNINYYASDAIQMALSSQLEVNNRQTKDTLESIVKGSDNIVFPLTDEYGTAKIDNLPVGLYLVVETKTPENVTSTVDPFLISVPTTDSVEADQNGDVVHGDTLLYDVDAYPKNQTGTPTLEKEVSDAAHGLAYGTADLGYNDVATASDGDELTYRLISDVPTISSTATYMTQYKFDDVMSKGVSYNEKDIKIAWYSSHDAAVGDYTAATAAEPTAVNGTNAVAIWNYGSEFFTVTYGSNSDGCETMTVALTDKGLKEVNTPVSSDQQYGKYSNSTMVIYYGAVVHADASVIYGDNGNPNDVTLKWSRTSNPEKHFDTLKDESKVYVYGIDLTKKFSDGGTKFDNVEFVIQNTSNVTGKMFVVAKEAKADGVAHSGRYYVTGFTTDEKSATHFIPNSGNGELLAYGLEEDTYVLTEVETASGYTLLKDPITVELTTSYTPGDQCGALSAAATVDRNLVTMEKAGNSDNALVPLTVLNTKDFDLPKTGGPGTLATTICGFLIVGAMAALAFFTRKRKHG